MLKRISGRGPHALRPLVAVGLPLVVLLAACSDETATPLEPEQEDPTSEVGSYLSSLPTWEEFAAPAPDAEMVAEAPSVFEQDGSKVCSVTEASITRNPEDVVTFSPDSEILWLGSLIQGRGHKNGLGSLLELPIRQRAPATVSIDILFSDNTRMVVAPDLASVGQAIGELIDRAQTAGHTAGSSIFFSQVESHSLEQSALKLGLSANYLAGSVKASLEAERSFESNTLTATFTQKMFTTSLVLPQSPTDVFSPAFTNELLQEQIDRGNLGPGNLPVYVGSITWGRMLLVTMTSTESIADMKAALSASSAFVDVQADARHKQVMDNSEIQVVAIGGHAQAAIDMIRTGNLDDYFVDDAPLTTARPISYVLRNLGDNTIAKVSETTEYQIRECEDGAIEQYRDEDDWRVAIGNDNLTEWALPTTRANVELAREVTTLTGGNVPLGSRITFEGAATNFPFDFYLANPRAADNVSTTVQAWGLVYLDQELNGNEAERWISVGDVDGLSGDHRGTLENDDFDLRIVRNDDVGGAEVYAMGIWVGDNGSRSGESITVYGDDVEVKFNNVPATGFVGFVAPFPIIGFSLDEDGGGDDIGVRDFFFATR